MVVFVGTSALLLGLICWIGQSLVFFSPETAQKFGLVEPASDMDTTFYIIEAESLGLADLLLTWTFPLAGLLMIVDSPAWPVLSLVAGGIYLYMSAAIILRRVYLIRHGKRVGTSSAIRTAYIFGALWIVLSVLMIVLAAVDLGWTV